MLCFVGWNSQATAVNPNKLNQVFCFVLIEFCAFGRDFLQPAVPIVLPNINYALSFALFLIIWPLSAKLSSL